MNTLTYSKTSIEKVKWFSHLNRTFLSNIEHSVVNNSLSHISIYRPRIYDNIRVISHSIIRIFPVNKTNLFTLSTSCHIIFFFLPSSWKGIHTLDILRELRGDISLKSNYWNTRKSWICHISHLKLSLQSFSNYPEQSSRKIFSNLLQNLRTNPPSTPCVRIFHVTSSGAPPHARYLPLFTLLIIKFFWKFISYGFLTQRD